MAMRSWVKWLLASSAAVLVVLVVAVAGLAWWAVEYTRPHVTVGAPMPELRLASFEDESELSLDELRGRVVVLDFWSSG